MNGYDWFLPELNMDRRWQDWNRSLSDEQFRDEVHRRASLFAELFPKKPSRIGLWGVNSLDFLIAFFGVIRGGHTAVPLSRRLTATELIDISTRADLNSILALDEIPRAHREALSGLPIHIIPALSDAIGNARASAIVANVNADNIAALICTSGSTARLKIVPLTLGSFLNHAHAMCSHLSVTRRDTWLVCLPFHHVGGLGIAFRCLASGASLHISRTPEPDELNTLIDRGKVSLVSVVPTVLERILRRRAGRPFPESIRAIIAGGGIVSSGLLERCPQAYATYGLTEAGSTVTCARLACGDNERMSAGPPLPNTEIRIIDGNGTDLPYGQSGEIVVRGPGMASRLIGDAELQKRVFRSGWIFTGDFGRLDGDGLLHAEGRREDMILSGGENVSPVEIQNALLRHPQIAAAVVLPVPNGDWGQSPAAFVVAEANGSLDKDQVLHFLDDKLARHKLPKTVFISDHLPELPNGKPDLKKIRKMLNAD